MKDSQEKRVLVTGGAGFLGAHLCDRVRRRPDISRGKELLGWEPKTSLKDGLKKTIDYFEHLFLNTKSA
jgi:UDP-glucuronate decarboxylase